MKINQMKRLISLIEEAEMRQATIESDRSMHPFIKNYLVGACLEMKNDLIDRMKNDHGFDLEL